MSKPGEIIQDMPPMTFTPGTPQVYEAIRNVMEDLGKVGISKDRKSQQGYKFRGIDDVYDALNGLMSSAGLIIIPRCLARTCDLRTSSNGGALYYVQVDMEFDLISALDGSKHTARTFGEAMDSGDKATNKAMSAAYKYMAFQTFCIPIEGDNDADATNHQLAPPTKPVYPIPQRLPEGVSEAEKIRNANKYMKDLGMAPGDRRTWAEPHGTGWAALALEAEQAGVRTVEALNAFVAGE